MKRPSYLSYAASVVARLIELAEEMGIKFTNLTILVLREVARAGPRCFLKLEKIAERIIQNNGKHPHPGSVQRILRQLREVGVLLGRRLYPGQNAHFKAWASTLRVNPGQGCLLVWLNKKLDFPDFEDCESPPETPVRMAAKHAAPTALVPPVVSVLNPDDLTFFQNEAAKATAAGSAVVTRLKQRADAAMYESVKRVRGPP